MKGGWRGIETRTMAIKVAIVEDDEQVRENLATLIRETDGFECVGTFPSGEDALDGMPRRAPDVVLMDVNLPGMSGVECVRLLKSQLPDLQVVILTVYDDSDRIFQALQMGASGYLLKRSTSEEILRAVADVHRGGAPMSSYIARKVVQSFQRQGPSEKPSENLTKRENDVLNYVSRGYTNKEIADALGLSAETVRGYLKTIYSKLHVRSRTEAALMFGA
jgi:DNA-binding NarL/FixJ family response regulator